MPCMMVIYLGKLLGTILILTYKDNFVLYLHSNHAVVGKQDPVSSSPSLDLSSSGRGQDNRPDTCLYDYGCDEEYERNEVVKSIFDNANFFKGDSVKISILQARQGFEIHCLPAPNVLLSSSSKGVPGVENCDDDRVSLRSLCC